MLIEFYGDKCPHCLAMKPLLRRLEKELRLKLKSYEVWHNEKNVKKMQECDKEECGGVPFYYNTKTKKGLCGEVPYAELKKWAEGE